ncbi:unnamed protein product [Rotaria socialis]|uniref:Uncharacterized protein n=1 Tax=Rotaria socialis TaxID=392032 RepID=A0A820PU86_9BILA|nr:unnamed protein product [Rotaria socialis]CAF3271039.1 unnamed protein product [Rotaria socialis]CAF3618667.1 unnamed protein product [Rotaria socialis]CAF4410004.1 unnamed protein product [Rotaria socialis]CAF4488836.1 unnamed protein product [Rotaria socialis]
MSAIVYHNNSANNPPSTMLFNNGTTVGKQRPSHNPPKNLSQSEIQCLYNILGKNCVTLATAVAQVLHGYDDIWRKLACGVLCFVKDYNKRNYCFRLYDLQLQEAIFEEIVPSSIRLEKKHDLFYVFDGMNFKIGFNFIDHVETETFCNHFHNKQENRQNKNKLQQSTNMQSMSIPVNMNEVKILPVDIKKGVKSVSSSDKSSKKQPTSKTEKNKTTRLLISSPIPSSFNHIIHVGSDQSFVTDDAQIILFKQVLSKMPLSPEEKMYVQHTITNTKDGLDKLFETSKHYCDNERDYVSNRPPKIPPRTYLASKQNNNNKHSPHQDISMPSLIYQRTSTTCPQTLSTSETSTVFEQSKVPVIPLRPCNDISNKTLLSIENPSPLPSSMPVNLKSQQSQPIIPSAPPLPAITVEPMRNESFISSLNSQRDALLQEIQENGHKRKLNQRSDVLTALPVNKSAIEVERTLEMNIFDMICKRRAMIMGCDNNNNNNDENDDANGSDDDDEW